MLELSQFLGIVISIFSREHPPPHFHAVYGEYQITVEINSGVVHGDFTIYLRFSDGIKGDVDLSDVKAECERLTPFGIEIPWKRDTAWHRPYGGRS